ncbi:hypothetical protein ACP3TJ_09775 [Desulforudis sp. 1088]|uniref:hypothetical protein n=1 Tax=unclassified Candidatus Desulforudis TaxID=2635950 RepID=UPI003CE5084E
MLIKPEYAALAAIINRLPMIRPGPRVFNQYHEEASGSAYRRGNLALYLTKMFEFKPRVLIVGEAPGFTGTRQSGIPFTSEAIMLRGLKNWDLFGTAYRYRQTSGVPGGWQDRAASTVWSILEESLHLPLLWYCFPCHPHREGQEESYRSPSEWEMEVGVGFVMELEQVFEFDRIVPVGERVATTLCKHEVKAVDPVDNPLRVGKERFGRQLMPHLERYAENKEDLLNRDNRLKMY